MPKKVDVNERKEKILKTALEIFAREGYRDANLSLIAEESGIARPTLYLYFQDKKDIFYYAVKVTTDRLFEEYSNIAWDKESTLDEIDRILLICKKVLEYASLNEAALSNLFEFMLSEKKQGIDFSFQIDNRTIKLRILLKRLIRQGIDNNTIKKMNPEEIASYIFGLVEACCIQLAFFKSFDKEKAFSLLSTYLNFIRVIN